MLFQFRKVVQKHKRNDKYQLWTHENHPIELTSNYFIDQKIEYIHNNPVEAGIVEKPEDYLYSSAKSFSGMKVITQIISTLKSIIF